VLKHDHTENDGNITLVPSTPAVTPVGASVSPFANISNSQGVDPNVIVTATTATRPLDVNIDFGSNTDRWVIYNEFNNSIPSPFYKVRFIGNEGWAGTGDTGHVVEHNASKTKNQRLGW
jgi:hypothetical protein